MSNEENGKGSEKRFVKGGQTKYENHGTFRVIGDDFQPFREIKGETWKAEREWNSDEEKKLRDMKRRSEKWIKHELKEQDENEMRPSGGNGNGSLEKKRNQWGKWGVLWTWYLGVSCTRTPLWYHVIMGGGSATIAQWKTNVLPSSFWNRIWYFRIANHTMAAGHKWSQVWAAMNLLGLNLYLCQNVFYDHVDYVLKCITTTMFFFLSRA